MIYQFLLGAELAASLLFLGLGGYHIGRGIAIVIRNKRKLKTGTGVHTVPAAGWYRVTFPEGDTTEIQLDGTAKVSNSCKLESINPPELDLKIQGSDDGISFGSIQSMQDHYEGYDFDREYFTSDEDADFTETMKDIEEKRRSARNRQRRVRYQQKRNEALKVSKKFKKKVSKK